MSLQVEELAVTYSTSAGVVQAVQDVSFTVEAGGITAIVGESGSGKSTTAQAIIGLLASNAQVTAGEIRLDDTTLVSGLRTKNQRKHKHRWHDIRGTRIGLVPQDPNNSLNPVRTIGQSVGEGLALHTNLTANQRKATVLEWLTKVGISDPERVYSQYPHQLSGGMKQRALIAAALVLEPDYIIADEPTSALDVTVQKVILDLIDSMRHDLGIGVLLITHDLAVAGDRADQVVVMQHGSVREVGYASAVLADPQDAYTQQLLADAPSLTVAAAPQRKPLDAASPVLLQVDNFTQTFGDFTAAENISFTVRAGSTHALVGESGSGKSTTGRAIAGFRAPSSGSILLGGSPIAVGQREVRKQVQLVYQNPYSSLDPRQSVQQIVGEPLKNFKLGSKAEIASKVDHYLELVALESQLRSRRPAELSGGQRQRVAIARALILEPELVVLDEAVSALDVTVQAQILRILSQLQEELGLTYVFISHDLAVVHEISDTVSVLSGGQQVESGATTEVFQHPQTEFTQHLLDAIPGKRFRDGSLNLGL
ncbi:MAG: ABC transporter ATP-binding protein [Corynebacterium sp.]|nr:ABC transporter ATP-binding protein [Corynebacterium sp.]